MLQPEQLAALTRDEAYNLIRELQGLERRLEYLRGELRRLAEDG
jgi:hypothetical protein